MGEIHGIKVCRGSPILTHFLFVDDYFLFFRVDDCEIMHFHNALRIYEHTYDQSINMEKSDIFVNTNTSVIVRDMVKTIFQVTKVIDPGKCLGLPSMVGRKRKPYSAAYDRVFGREFKV